ncbi:MAG: hypothetical protein OXU20_00905 [Myxococcales bacterium]|nr:hypothetical protein [Myxococcales bacterium]
MGGWFRLTQARREGVFGMNGVHAASGSWRSLLDMPCREIAVGVLVTVKIVV